MSLGSQVVRTIRVNDYDVEIVGCWDENTPDNEYDYYDFFVDGECINLGEPHYDKEKGLKEAIEAHLEMYEQSLK